MKVIYIETCWTYKKESARDQGTQNMGHLFTLGRVKKKHHIQGLVNVHEVALYSHTSQF